MWKPKYFHEIDDEHRVEHDARVGEPLAVAEQPRRRVEAAGLQHQRDQITPVTTSESTNGAKYRTRSSARPLQARVEHQRDAERERQLHAQREHDEDPVVLRARR